LVEMDGQTLFQIFKLVFAAYCGFIVGAFWIVWKTRDWVDPKHNGIVTTGSGDRPPKPRR
jgi:hypothetical protein